MERVTERRHIADLQRRIAELEAENRQLSARVAAAAGPGDGGVHAEQIYKVVEASRQAVVVHLANRPLYFNPALIDLLGLDSRDAYQDIMAFVHPEDRPAVAAAARRFLAGEVLPPTGEFRVLRADGRQVWVEASTTTVDWHGSPAVATAMIPVDDRKAAEQDVRRSRRLFQTVFDTCPEVMTINDMATGCYVDVNRAFLHQSGLTREEVIGRTVDDLQFFGPADRALISRSLRGRDRVRDLELQARFRNGRERSFLVDGEVLRFPGQKLVLMVARDITDRRRQEIELRRSREAAEQASQSKSRFLASVSHELRTPLNAIIGFSEVMRDEMLGPLGVARYADYAGDIHRSGSHLLDIINDLLDLSKMEAGKLELKAEPLSPATVIRDSLGFLRDRAAATGVTLEADLPDGLPDLFADPRLLRQILLNLTANALNFTPAGGRVVAGARLSAEGVLTLYVDDSGPGMTEAEVAVALTPFGQVAEPKNRREHGTGLGLPLAQQMAQLHGASMRIDSRPGRGTTVSVAMPQARVRPTGAGAAGADGAQDPSGR